jgi:mannosyl-3-phosphoglycerate synthase
LGALLAAGLGYDYVGYIDSDNYVPGSVHEYAWIYYAGFSLSTSPYTMIRIKWPFKGKLSTGYMYLRRRGRVSIVTNSILNYTLSLARRVETEVIQTGNSGEHAMSTRMALNMKWAGGFAVESYQLVYMLESCYLGLEKGECRMLPEGISLYQVEARNPHIHAERGDEHIVEMVAKSMGTIYYSELAHKEVKQRIIKTLQDYGWEGEPPKPIIYDPYGIDAEKVVARFLSESPHAHFYEAR